MESEASAAVAEWIAAGIYDPEKPGAAGRLALLQWIAGFGVGTDAMVEAAACNQLTSLVGDLTLRPGARLTPAQMAARFGMTLPEMADLRRATGLPPAGPDDPVFTEDDAPMFELFLAAAAFFSRDELLHFTRVVASAVRRIAEAAGEMFLRDVEAPLHESGRDELGLAQANLAGIELSHSATGIFEPLFRAHLEAATANVRRARASAKGYDTMPLAIGFVDLSGFTTMSGAMTPDDLLSLVMTFESTAIDLVAEHGGRLIKLIGDEVMFTAVEASEACTIAAELVRRAGNSAIGARGGLAFGPVVTSGGDVYGAVVNLAARIVDLAVPGEVLVDGSVVAAAPGYVFEPAGRRQLKGFAEPVRLWSLEQ